MDKRLNLLPRIGLVVIYAITFGMIFNLETVLISEPTWVLTWGALINIGFFIVGLYLVWDCENTIEMIKATAHDFKVEARGFWFVLKTQPIWFSFIITPYIVLWRIPVGLVLGTIALIIALFAIAVRTFYELIAPQIQSTWVPDSESYTRAVRVYYAKCETEFELRKGRAERKAAKKARKTGEKGKSNVTKIDKHSKKTRH